MPWVSAFTTGHHLYDHRRRRFCRTAQLSPPKISSPPGLLPATLHPMTSALPCGVSHEPGLARSFSDDPQALDPSLNQPASPSSRGIPPLISLRVTCASAVGHPLARTISPPCNPRTASCLSRHVATSRSRFLPNPLISRVCTPLHINQIFSLAPASTPSLQKSTLIPALRPCDAPSEIPPGIHTFHTIIRTIIQQHFSIHFSVSVQVTSIFNQKSAQ